MPRCNAPLGIPVDPQASVRLKPLVPVIPAGGVGSRLWPLSRALFPKPFHALFGEGSLLQGTVLRAKKAAGRPPIVFCNVHNRFLAAEQLRAVGLDWRHIGLEPEARNTAPAIALAAHLAVRDDEEAQLLVLPADHIIDDDAKSVRAVETAAAASGHGAVVAFGIAPSRPETGYGYIELAEGRGTGAQRIGSFVEKPDRARTRAFAASGRHLWNSGMFLTDARVVLQELEAYSRDVAHAVARSVREGRYDLDFFRSGEAFLESPTVSFDVAVMERTARAAVLPVDFGWSDIRSWESILEVSGVDGKGNHLAGDVLTVKVQDTLIHEGHRLVSAIGVEGLLVIETADAVLVADRDRAQDVAALVERLKDSNRSERLLHREVFRLWGSYERIARGERYLVKRFRIEPGASVSLQIHRHRAEHWVVVRDTAEVTRGEETFTLRENENTFIPPGVRHRLGNAGKVTLKIIEVQVGGYLGEDDFVRLADRYGRAKD